MSSVSRVIAFLRQHSVPCGFEQLPQDVRGMFPSPDEGLLRAEFYVADARRRCYFEFFEAVEPATGVGKSHEGNIVLVQNTDFLVLLTSRGGAGDIWESFGLPMENVQCVAFRTRIGRK